MEFERRLKLFVIAALGCTGLFLLFRIDNLLTSIVLALVFFYLLNPWVDFLERKGFTRTWAVVIPFITVTGVLALAVYSVFPTLGSQFVSLRDQFSSLVENANSQLTPSESFIQTHLGVDVRASLLGWAKDQLKSLPEILSQSLTVLFLSPFLGFFMLLDGRELIRMTLSLVPNPHFELALNLNHQISTQIGGFIRARMVETLIVALIVFLGLQIMSFPNSLFLGIFAGVANLVPYVGPVIAVVPAILIGLTNSVGSDVLVWVGLIYLLGQVVDAVFIVPVVVARIVNLHPATVVLVVIVGAHFLGIIGMIISIPLYSAAKVTLSSLYMHLLDFRA